MENAFRKNEVDRSDLCIDMLIRGMDQMCGKYCETAGRRMTCVNRCGGSASFPVRARWACIPPSNLRRRGGCWPNFASYQPGRVLFYLLSNIRGKSHVWIDGVDSMCGSDAWKMLCKCKENEVDRMCGSMVLVRGVDQMCGNGCETEGGWFACVDRPVGSAFFDARWACIPPF